MNINRHNYEEYFLLYVDHELKADERAAVELFIQENPDLREELRMLEQTVLRPEKKISFADKASLLKSTMDINTINESNFEEYFILYGDDELTNSEKDSVEQFVYKNPQHQASFELFQQARVSADTNIVFPDKKSLYRSEKDERVVVIRWWKIAAAAAVILFIGGSALYFSGIIGQDKTEPSGIATKEAEKKSAVPQKIEQVPANPLQQENAPVDIAQSPVNTENPSELKNSTQVKKDDVLRRKEVVTTPDQQPAHQLVAENQPKKVQEDSNPGTTSSVKPIDTEIAKVTVKAPEKVEQVVFSSTDADRDFAALAVNDPKDNQEEFTSNNRIEVLNTSVSNKGKMRGFFRKVGRVVDKATNFGNSAEKDTDKKGVRIASFEIALK